MVDYIVVGFGLAGVAFCDELERNGKEFVVFNNSSQQSSLVAGGLYNPVILKRFTLAWNAKQQLDAANAFYNELSSRLQTEIDQKIPVKRRFVSVEEQNTWFLAADKPGLSNFLNSEVQVDTNPSVELSNGLGEVKHTGRVLVKQCIDSFKSSLGERYINKGFDHNELLIDEDHVQYENVTAKHIVFAEGYGLQQNPFFNYLPLTGTKGELLTIKAPSLKLNYVLKSSVFIIPLGDDLYEIGATYNWTDKSNAPTQEGKDELLTKLKSFLTCDFEVVKQSAGIRPTVIDRRPLVGRHSNHNHLYVLNGLGTRGVMIAPTIAKELYDFIENDKPLNGEINISRFES